MNKSRRTAYGQVSRRGAAEMEGIMFGELNGGDSMMETLGLQFKDKIYDEKRTVFIFETEKVKIKILQKI